MGSKLRMNDALALASRSLSCQDILNSDWVHHVIRFFSLANTMAVKVHVCMSFDT